MKLVTTSLFLFSTTRAQTPGWYHSAEQQSCTEKCAEIGIPFQTERTDLVCTQSNFEVVLNNLRNSNTFSGCQSFRDETTHGSPPMRQQNGDCLFRSTGAQFGNNKDDVERICCCSETGTSSLADCPLREISSCSQCGIVQFIPTSGYADVCHNTVCNTGQTYINGECVCDDPLATFNQTDSLCHYPAKNFTINCDDPSELIDEIFDDDTAEKIKEHGCHCTKLSALSIVQNYVGGAGKVDIIDSQCRDWFNARRCTQQNSCKGFNLKDYDYTLVIEGLSHIAYCEQLFQLGYSAEELQCLYDVCVIDSTYALDVLYSLEDIYVDWTSIVVTENMCPHCEKEPCSSKGQCSGTPPLYK